MNVALDFIARGLKLDCQVADRNLTSTLHDIEDPAQFAPTGLVGDFTYASDEKKNPNSPHGKQERGQERRADERAPDFQRAASHG